MIQKKDNKEATEEIKRTLGDFDVDLSTDEKKDSFAARRLLTHTQGVMNAAIAQYRNVDLVLAQIVEWGEIVSRFITHDKAFMSHNTAELRLTINMFIHEHVYKNSYLSSKLLKSILVN